MITSFWSKKPTAPAPKQVIVRLEKKIKDLEVKIDPKKSYFKAQAWELSKIVGSSTIGAGTGTATGMIYLSSTALVTLFGASVIGAGGALALVSYFSGGLSIPTGRKFIYKEINTLTRELTKAKIEALNDVVDGDVCDFVFNHKHSIELETKDLKQRKKQQELNESAKENKKVSKKDAAVIPVKMDKKMLSDLMDALESRVDENIDVTLRKIDISDASLTAKKLNTLLTAQLGAFNTEHLILRNNLLDDESVEFLKKRIVDKKDAFQNLKTLNLEGNNLTGACLPHILAIVQHLKLQKLVLSNNPLLASQFRDRKPIPGTAEPMVEFLKQAPSKMASLRKLYLSNTGLQEAHAPEIGNFLRKSTLLQLCDVQNNKGFTYPSMVDSVKEQGLMKSISLKELRSDHRTLRVSTILSKRDTAFEDSADDKSEETPWALHLLNYKMQHKKLPSATAKYLSKTAFSETTIKQIIETIQDARTQHLGVREGMAITITERELIAYYSKELHELYKRVRAGDANDEVEDELIQNIREVKQPKQRQRRATTRKEKDPEIETLKKTKRNTPRKTVPRSTKAKTLALPAPKKAASKDVSQVDTQDANVPNATTQQHPQVLNQFNAARNASLRAEIEQSLSAYALSRNPQLNKQTTPNQKTTRFRV